VLIDVTVHNHQHLQLMQYATVTFIHTKQAP